MRRLAAAALVATAALALAACGGGSKTSEGTTAPGVNLGSGCSPVPPLVERRLRRGIVLVGAKLVRPRIVKSSELDGYYFISARVPQIAADAVATWATQGVAPVKQVIAVDEYAREISEFGSGTKHDPPVTLDTGGAQESRDCVTRAAG